MTPVAELLRDSRAAHVAGRAAKAKGDDPRAHWQTALELRLKARRIDPDRLDMAWLEDALHRQMPREKQRRYHRIPGLSTPQVAHAKDAEFVDFYRAQLDREDAAPPAPLTEAEMIAKVIVPKAYRSVKAGVTPCTCGHEKSAHQVLSFVPGALVITPAIIEPCTIDLAPGQPCPCTAYEPAPCTHLWRVNGDARTCAACDEQQQLVETMAATDTEAFKQLQLENER